MLDGYLKEQLKFTEEVTDKMETIDEVTETFINEEIRNDEELRKNFGYSTEKWISKIDKDTSRGAAAHQAEKAYDFLENIDTNIFAKFTHEEKQLVSSKFNKIQEILDSLRSDLNV